MNPNQPQYPVPGNQPAPAGAGRGLSFALSDVIVGGAAFLFFIFSFTPFVSSGCPASTDLWDFTSPLGWWAAVANVLAAGHRRRRAAVAARQRVCRLPSQPGAGRRSGSTSSSSSSASCSPTSSIFGWGGWLMLICSLVALAGAVLGHLGMLQEPVAIPTGRLQAGRIPGLQHPRPGGYAPPQAQAGYEPPTRTTRRARRRRSRRADDAYLTDPLHAQRRRHTP